MGDSYNRKCRSCGKPIQMRQMPHGQWVAFEGYDTPHKCSKEEHSETTNLANHSKSNSNYSSYNTPPIYSSSKSNSGSADKSSHKSFWDILPVIIIIIVVVIIIYSCLGT